MLFPKSGRWLLVLFACAVAVALAVQVPFASGTKPPRKDEKLGPAIKLGPQTPPKGSPGPIFSPGKKTQVGAPLQLPQRPGGKAPQGRKPIRPKPQNLRKPIGNLPPAGQTPGWLPAKRPVVPVFSKVRPVPKTVVVGGTTLVVEDPAVYPVTVLPRRVFVPLGIGDSVAVPSGETATLGGGEGPLVQFGRLADHRLRELHAYEMQGQSSDSNITQAGDGGWTKVYYRFPVQSIRVGFPDTTPPNFVGEIVYDRVLYVQSAADREDVVRETGTPVPDVEPVRSTEEYAFAGGKWAFVEE